jgi:hypothetical protein
MTYAILTVWFAEIKSQEFDHSSEVSVSFSSLVNKFEEENNLSVIEW